MLAAGGHAVDAAVATSFAVGVLEPWMNGIGGVGAMLVRHAADDRVTAIDFGARSPAALDPADYPLVEGSVTDLFGWPRVKDDRNLRRRQGGRGADAGRRHGGGPQGVRA